MKRIRIGKDISMRWEITTDGVAIPLEGRDLTIEIKSPAGIENNIPYRVEGNILIMTYYGYEQKRPGEYSITLWEKKGKPGQNVVDVIRAFELVRTSQEENDFVGGDLQIESVDLGTENFDILTEGGYRAINIDTLQADALKDSVNINGKTYSNESFTITLPKANLDSAGVMSADDKKALQDHGNSISQLESTTSGHSNAISQINAKLDEHTESINAKITTDRIADGAVTSDKIATSAFDDTLSVSGKIAPSDVVGRKLSELEKELTIKGEGFDWKVGYIANNGQVAIMENHPKSYICLEPKIYTENKTYTIPDGMILVVKKGSSPTSLSVVAEGSAPNFEMYIKNDGQYTSYSLRYSDLSDISPSEGINAASRKKRLDDIDNRLSGLNAELTDLKAISTYQEEYVLDNAVSQLNDCCVSSRGIIDAYSSYNIKLYKLEANKKYLLRRKVEWSGVYLGYVAEFDINNFVVGGSATSIIFGSTNISEQEVSYGVDTYISILSKNDRGTFYEIVGFNDKGVVDVKQDLDSIETELQSIEKVARKSIVIKRTDDNIQLYDKLLLAYSEGNTDVYFETGTYILNEVYSYMKNTLGYTSMYEMQIGNGCRYYLGGSTLISKHVVDILDSDRSVFGTRMNSSDYELHDGILITDSGHYCVHDDTQIYDKQYKHGYYNMAFFCTNDDNVRVPEAPLGCGVGKYVTTIFENCIFDSVSDTSFFVHGIINDTKHIVVNYKLTFSNCWFGKSVGISSYLTNEDDITLTLTNCSFKWAMSGTEKCKRVFEWGNEVRN